MNNNYDITLTDQEREVIRHALGFGGTDQTRESFRNYYLAGNSGDDYDIWSGLVSRGLAVWWRAPGGNGTYFAAKKAAALAARRANEGFTKETMNGLDMLEKKCDGFHDTMSGVMVMVEEKRTTCQVGVKVSNFQTDFDGNTVEEVIFGLRALLDTIPEEYRHNARFGGNRHYSIYYEREETEEERIEREKEEAERMDYVERKERSELARLKAKYPDA